MAAPYNPPVKNEDFIIYVFLRDAADGLRVRANPTIAAGDFQVSKDGAAFGDLATLPTVTPASGRAVKITLSAAEMNADNVTVQCVDQTDPPEWGDLTFCIPTTQ